MSDRRLRERQRAAATDDPGAKARYAAELARAGRADEALWRGAMAGPPRCVVFWEPAWTAPPGAPGRAAVMPFAAVQGELNVPVECRTFDDDGRHHGWTFLLKGHGVWGWVNAVEFRCRETGRVLKLRRLGEALHLASNVELRLTWNLTPELGA